MKSHFVINFGHNFPSSFTSFSRRRGQTIILLRWSWSETRRTISPSPVTAIITDSVCIFALCIVDHLYLCETISWNVKETYTLEATPK